MFMPRKKDVLNELAFCLHLMLEFDPDTTALSFIQRIKKKAAIALEEAQRFTGQINQAAVQEFMTTKHLIFSVECGSDITIGDTIRFSERIYDNRHKPPRDIGKRGVIAKVVDIIANKPKNPLLHLRVISCGGNWQIKKDEEIFRTLKIVTRMEVKRVRWEDEQLRRATVQKTRDKLQSITIAKSQIFDPHDKL